MTVFKLLIMQQLTTFPMAHIPCGMTLHTVNFPSLVLSLSLLPISLSLTEVHTLLQTGGICAYNLSVSTWYFR